MSEFAREICAGFVLPPQGMVSQSRTPKLENGILLLPCLAQGLLRARYERERDPTVREAIAAAVSIRPLGDAARPSDWAEGKRSGAGGFKAGE